MIKGIKQGQVVVGKVKHPKVGMLPTNLILFAVEGEVEDLGLEVEWIQEPVVFETTVDLGHKEGYVLLKASLARSIKRPVVNWNVWLILSMDLLPVTTLTYMILPTASLCC